AKYIENQIYYNVSFFVDDNLFHSLDVIQHSVISPQQPPDKEGFSFLYWELADTQEEFNFDTQINSDIILNAKYIENQIYYNVSFFVDDSLFACQQILHNNHALFEQPPQKQGYDFLFWTTNNQEEYDFSTTVISDINLYACYEKQSFVVEFYLDNILLNDYTQIVHYNETAESVLLQEQFYIISSFHLQDSIDAFDFLTPITTDTKLYATKTENFYMLTYYDGDFSISQKVEKGEAICDILEPQNTEEDFIGWQETDSNSNYDFSVVLTSDITLYAVYESDFFNVIFNPDGGVCQNGQLEQKIKHGFSATPPDHPQKEGHCFIGWDKDYQNITSDRQIKALYSVNKYQIDYYLYENKVYQQIDIPHMSTVSLYDAVDELLDGDFIVFWRKSSLQGEIFDQSAPITEDIELYGQIEKIPLTVFYHFGDEIIEQNLRYNDTIVPPDNPTPADGYEFVGWYEEDSFLIPYIFYSSITQETHLYGKQRLQTFDVTFIYQIGDESYQIIQNISYGKKAKDNISLDAYSLLWFLDEAHCVEYDFNNIVVEDTILYGLASPNKYTITIVYPDYLQLPQENIELFYGDNINLPLFDIYGYSHNGYLDETQNAFDLQYMPAYDFEVYPQFETKMFTLNLDDIYQIEAKYLTEVNLYEYSAPTGYYFDGWLDENNSLFSSGQPYSVERDMSFTPKLTKIREVIINYLSFSQVYDYGGDVEIQDPKKDGYIFIGWYSDENLSIPFNNKAISEEYEIYLYPKWAKESYFIYIYEEQRKLEVGYGELSPSQIMPSTPEGHTFEGWFLDDEFSLIYEPVEITEDITLYPKYNIKTFEVTFMGLNDRIISLQTVEYGSAAQPPGSRECFEEGYLFDGFDDDYNNIEKDTVINAQYKLLFVNIFFDEEGQEINTELPPQKEGYTFVGWETVQDENCFLHYPKYLADSSEENQSPEQSHEDEEENEPEEEQSQDDDSFEKIVGRLIFNDPPSQGEQSSSSFSSSSNSPIITLINRNLDIIDISLVIFTLILASFSLHLNLKHKNKADL
ncbi:MAG: InlB B-repeat-containing protein, partial [Bacillota bacterium]